MSQLTNLLYKHKFNLVKSDTKDLQYFVKNNVKIYFSEYDLNNSYLPIFEQLFWTNNIDEILKYYETQTTKKN